MHTCLILKTLELKLDAADHHINFHTFRRKRCLKGLSAKPKCIPFIGADCQCNQTYCS